MESSERLARFTGAPYLAVAVFSTFAIRFLRPTVYVADDAAAPTANLAANEGLFRLGFLTDLTQSAAILLVAIPRRLLFQHVNKNTVRAIVVFAVISTVIQSLKPGTLPSGAQPSHRTFTH